MIEIEERPEDSYGFEAIGQALTFLRSAANAPGAPALQALLNALDLHGDLPDLRLRLRGRLRSALVGNAEMLRVFDAVTEQLPLKAAARNLHLSLRQLYRVRDALIENLRTALADRERSSASASQDLAELHLDCAYRQLLLGFAPEAHRRALSLIATAPPPSIAARAYAIAARAMVDCGQFKTALDLLISAKARAATAIDQHAIVAAESFMQYRCGNLSAAIAGLERTLERPPSARVAAEIRSVPFVHFLATLHQEAGSNRRSLALLLDARALLAERRDAPKWAMSENLVLCAIARLGLRGQAATARVEAGEALCLAQRHSLEREEAWSKLAIALLLVGKRDLPQAVSYAREAAGIAQSFLAGDDLLRIFAELARIETRAGNAHEGLRGISRARDAVPFRAPYSEAIVSLAEADAMAKSGASETALQRSEVAIATMERKNSSHSIGLGYLTRSEVQVHLDDKVVSIQHALRYLRNGAYIANLAGALELSARLTGNAADAQEAVELRAEAFF